MKRKLLITTLVGGILLTGIGFSVQANNDGDVVKVQPSQTETKKENTKETIISSSEAKDIAVEEVKGNVEEVELEEENGKKYYEVEIDVKGKDDDKEVHFDAISGKVISTQVDNDDDDDDRKAKKIVNKDTLISLERAIEIALEHVDGKVVDIELDEDDNMYIYEIEVKTTNGEEAELEISALNGNVLELDIEREDD